MSTLPLKETRSPVGSSLNDRLVTDNVTRIEFLQDPAVLTDYMINANTEVILRRITYLVSAFGSIRRGTKVNIVTNTLVMDRGNILFKDYIFINNTVLTLPVTPTPNFTGKLYIKFVEDRVTSASDPLDLQFTPTAGAPFDTHNEYRLTFDYLLSSTLPVNTDNGIRRVTYLALGDVTTDSSGNYVSITNQYILSIDLNQFLNDDKIADIAYKSTVNIFTKVQSVRRVYDYNVALHAGTGLQYIVLDNKSNMFDINNPIDMHIGAINLIADFVPGTIVHLRFKNKGYIDPTNFIDCGGIANDARSPEYSLRVMPGVFYSFALSGGSAPHFDLGVWQLLSQSDPSKTRAGRFIVSDFINSNTLNLEVKGVNPNQTKKQVKIIADYDNYLDKDNDYNLPNHSGIFNIVRHTDLNWLDFTPTITTPSNITVSNVIDMKYRYILIGKVLHISINFKCDIDVPLTIYTYPALVGGGVTLSTFGISSFSFGINLPNGYTSYGVTTGYGKLIKQPTLWDGITPPNGLFYDPYYFLSPVDMKIHSEHNQNILQFTSMNWGAICGPNMEFWSAPIQVNINQ